MVCRVNMSYINGACQCNKNSYIRNGSCYGCWPHAYATNDGTNCTCASPYIADTLNYKTCVLVNTNCGKGSTFNITTQSCQCIYTNGIINPKTSDCQCGVNMVLNSESTACVCDSLSYIYALTCIKCWNNSSPNAQLTSCNCNSGFYRSFENPRLCITQTQCFDNAFFNATIEGCQCLYPSQHLGATACVCP